MTQHSASEPAAAGRFRRMTLALIVGLLVGASAQAQDVLRASPFGPPAHLLNRQVLKSWAESVKQATSGRVSVEVLAQPVAPPPGIKAAVERGLADVSVMSNGALVEPMPLNAVVEFAAQSPDALRSSVAYQRVFSRYPAMQDEFGAVVVLAVFTHGPGALMLSDRGAAQIGTPAALTLHAGGTGAQSAAKAIGAKSIFAPGPAARDLMTKGEVDGTVTPLDSYTGLGLVEQVKSVIETPGGFYNAGLSLVMNRGRWNGLSEADRTAVLSVSGEAFARKAGQAWDEGDARAREALRRASIAPFQANTDLVEKLLAARQQLERSWIDGRGLLAADAENALAEYREEIAAQGTASASPKIKP